MPASARSWLPIVALKLLLGATAASAQSGVYLPPAPQGPGGEDTIETQSGTRCRQSINSNEGYLDVGVSGSTASGIPSNGNIFVSINERDRQALGYARITVPLGRKPKRLDCSRIYELEIQRLRDELALLKMNAE
ncbi:hypothetical protein [Sphingomonas humi]|uniref:Secreted protein n=1 Tax=Sphingomonas humi TaxID=335630 RepID=A0ABP7RUA4_9SPHN